MAYFENDHDLIEHRFSGVIGTAFDRMLKFVKEWIEAHRVRRQQKIDRKAFLTLVGKEDWVYADMGIHAGDVDWAAKLPIETNAALELEKIRQQTRRSI